MSNYIYIFLDYKLNPYMYCTTKKLLDNNLVQNYEMLQGKHVRQVSDRYTEELRSNVLVIPYKITDDNDLSNFWITRRQVSGTKFIGYVEKDGKILVSYDNGALSPFNNISITVEPSKNFLKGRATVRHKIKFDKLKRVTVEEISAVEYIAFLYDIDNNRSLGYHNSYVKALDYGAKLRQLGYKFWCIKVVRRNSDEKIYHKIWNNRHVFSGDKKASEISLGEYLSDELIAKYTILS